MIECGSDQQSIKDGRAPRVGEIVEVRGKAGMRYLVKWSGGHRTLTRLRAAALVVRR